MASFLESPSGAGAGLPPNAPPARREEETIYNLLPKEIGAYERPPMYRSKYDPKANVPFSTLRESGGGFYGSGKNGADPKKFLRRGTGTARLSASSRAKREARVEDNKGLPSKPPIPKKTEVGAVACVRPSAKNFITTNAVDAILSVPKNGAMKPPQVSYLNKEDYGKIPEYLHHVKNEIAAENEMIEEFVNRQMGGEDRVQAELISMPEAERLQLVDGLKVKWDLINSKYQRLCHNTFYENSRKLEKQRLEAELDEIEADLSKLRNAPLFISP